MTPAMPSPMLTEMTSSALWGNTVPTMFLVAISSRSAFPSRKRSLTALSEDSNPPPLLKSDGSTDIIISGVLDARAYTTPIAKTIDAADMAIISLFCRFEADDAPPSEIISVGLVFSAHFCLVTRRGSFCMKSGRRSNFILGLLLASRCRSSSAPPPSSSSSSFAFGGGIGPDDVVGRALFVPTMLSPPRATDDAPPRRSCRLPFAAFVAVLAERRPHEGANARTLFPPLLLLVTEQSPITATTDNVLSRIRSLILLRRPNGIFLCVRE